MVVSIAIRSKTATALKRGLTLGRRSISSFNWEDAFDIQGDLTEEETAIWQTARSYAQEKLQPRIIEASRTETFDPNILKEMGELGLLGCNIKGYGCAGASNVAYGLIAREVERVDSGYRSAFSVQSSLSMTALEKFASEELKEKYIPKMATGDIIGAFGLTEPNHGSDPGSMETTAKPHPTKKGVYVLNGSKTWISNSPIAHVFIVWAKLDGVIRGFLVEREGQPVGALSTPQIKNKSALRASITGMIQMDNAEVPEENMFQNVEGLTGPFTCLNSARYGIAWGTMGALEGAIDLARNYALERKQFRQPLARYQLVQKKLADALTDVTYGLNAAYRLGKLKDEGRLVPEMISIVKRQNCDRALHNSRVLMEVFGGNAASDEYQIGRIAGNLFVAQTYEGQSDIHAMIIGRAMTGLGAFTAK
ncbi:hypothetical protein CANCADRAFT_95799 [Tortispora caseinolytica NRRL Y-17796]|uniref:Glutaryl-CoA dehydrogenase n=1 Tax=Tortispora caseinolytica NRRL Y-17796 TaxID=767744 RepID=A0A1E4TMR1_9ASCO|nr:hypothetical protein CANCADRAFT_95799 [Tortispora caseinolytica NRRL Y-17796]